MEKKKDLLKGFIIGAVLMLLLMTATGAIDKRTDNVTKNTSVSFQSIYASDNGNVVYVCDNDTVYRSVDSGASWSVVLKKKESGL